MNVFLINRSSVFSPSRKAADALILDLTGQELERLGHRVRTISEDELISMGNVPDGTDAVLQMCRDERALDILDVSCLPVINSTAAVRNCRRANQARLLASTGLIPASAVCDTNDIPAGWTLFPCWVKRGDAHAVCKDDVCFAADRNECVSLMSDMNRRGIKKCVLQAHVQGVLVKFYGTAYDGLVWYGTMGPEDGKFGLEQHNDAALQGWKTNADMLQQVAMTAARILGTQVFGGDVVVAPDGKMILIDFNDWPSFGNCAQAAAMCIAKLAVKNMTI